MVDLFRERKWDLVGRRWICCLLSLVFVCAGACAQDDLRLVLQAQPVAELEYVFEREVAANEVNALKVKRALLESLPPTPEGLGERRAIDLPGPPYHRVVISTRADSEGALADQDRRAQAALRAKIALEFEASKSVTTPNKLLLENIVTILERRVNSAGLSEVQIRMQPPDRVVVDIPGVLDRKAAVALLLKPAVLQFRHIPPDIAMTVTDEGSHEFHRGDRQLSTRSVLDEAAVILTGGDLEPKCYPTAGPTDTVEVAFTFKAEAAQKFRDFTSLHVHQHVAIVLDGELLSAPKIMAPIGRRGLISGDFTVKEAADLSSLLNAGALPLPLVVVEEKAL